MKNTKHTPGEWTAFEKEHTKGNGYWHIESKEFELSGFTGEANARLIAASPLLLEAALQMIIALDDAKERLPKSLQIRVAWDKLNNAIQEATIS